MGIEARFFCLLARGLVIIQANAQLLRLLSYCCAVKQSYCTQYHKKI